MAGWILPDGKPYLKTILDNYSKNKKHKHAKLAKFVNILENKLKRYVKNLKSKLENSNFKDWEGFTFEFENIYDEFEESHDWRPVPNLHYEFLYGMFLFTIKKNTLQFSRCSDLFIIENENVTLMTYPAGIAHTGNVYKKNKDIVISYHENDMMVKLAFMNYTECNKMLKHNEKTNVKNVDFKILKL